MDLFYPVGSVRFQAAWRKSLDTGSGSGKLVPIFGGGGEAKAPEEEETVAWPAQGPAGKDRQEVTVMGLYELPGMTLIPQQMSMSCWYASAQMLIQWRQDKTQESLPWLVPPDLDAQCVNIRDADSGVDNPQIMAMARRLGLQPVPPVSPTPEALESWLRTYGPLWVNGKSHITVIAGIDTDKQMVKVYDPSPVGKGEIEWRSLSAWYAMGTAVDSRDTGQDVDAVFLYVPLHTPGAPSATPPTATIYTVVAGDNLSKISQSFYGTPNQWNKIYQANKKVIGGNPNKLSVGQRLTIP